MRWLDHFSLMEQTTLVHNLSLAGTNTFSFALFMEYLRIKLNYSEMGMYPVYPWISGKEQWYIHSKHWCSEFGGQNNCKIFQNDHKMSP